MPTKRSFEASSPRQRRAVRRPLPRGHYRYVRRRWHVVCALIDMIGSLAFATARWLARRRRSWAVDDSQVQRILLIQLDHLGDAAITLQVLPALARRFPAASIDVLAGAWTSELFAASPAVDRVYISRTNRFRNRGYGRWLPAMVRWGPTLHRHRYDVAIDVRGDLPIALLLWLTGARHRIGWAAAGGGFLLTDSPDYVAGRPEIESRWALLACLGVARDQSAPSNSGLQIDSAARRRAARILGDLSGQSRPCVVLHLGAGTDAKRWPITHWRTLIDALIDTERANVLLVGADADRARASSITGGRPDGVRDLTGRLRLGELAALLDAADVFVGGDSGPAHLAAKLAAATVVIFSSTNEIDQWRPRGARVRVLRHNVACQPCHRTECVWSEHPCMNGISPARVLLAVRQALRQHTDRSVAPRTADDCGRNPDLTLSSRGAA